MNIIELIHKIKDISIDLDTCNSVFDGDVYENWNTNEIKYGSINIGIESVTHSNNMAVYNVVMYYSDRLLQDKSNTNSIYTDAVNTLQTIVNLLNEEDYISIEDDITYTFFSQKFADYLAGAYCRISITTNNPIGLCNMDLM